MGSRYIGSKWKKTAVLLQTKEIASYVPNTKRLTRSSLETMLHEYGMVYVKPDVGTFGQGVMRVERKTGTSGELYRYQSGTKARDFARFDDLFRSLLQRTRGRSYLVQKGIQLLKHNGRRFDIRVMVQHDPHKNWETTALIGRVAAPRKVVTNYHSGGTPMPVETLLAPHLGRVNRHLLIQEMRTMGKQVAKRLQASFSGIREIGIDVGIDHTFRPWIFEVNTKPDPYIFRHLPDKRIVRKVIRYAKAYGRL